MRWAWRSPRSCWPTSSTAPGHAIVDHRTYVFLGDGCLMEGISHEACSLAGTLALGKLIALYDDNGISIDGAVARLVRRRHAGALPRLRLARDRPDRRPRRRRRRCRAIERGAGQRRRRPTLIVCRTTIGRGSPGRAGTAKAHGEPLGADEIAATRAALGWPHAPFEVPRRRARALGRARAPARAREAAWQRALRRLPRGASRRWPPSSSAAPAGELPADFARRRAGGAGGAHWPARAKPLATRKASQHALDALAPQLPELLGGSADLTGSNLTDFPGCGAVRGGRPAGATSTTACASSAWRR